MVDYDLMVNWWFIPDGYGELMTNNGSIYGES